MGTLRRCAMALVLAAALATVIYAPLIKADPDTPQIPHTTSGHEQCLSCHGTQGVKPTPPSHTTFDEDSCLSCHSSSGGSSPETPCLSCHSRQPDSTMTFANDESLSLYINPEAFAASIHGDKLSCTDCHSSITTYPHPERESSSQREYNIAQSEICSRCHQNISQMYAASVHGKTVIEEANYDTPVCNDCHTSHTIEDPRTAAFRLESVELCSNCHNDERLMQKYGISTNVVKTYLNDFHGRTTALIGKQSEDIWVDEAICTDCHGIHDIQKVDSPDSPVIKANLVDTCRKCHPEATVNFPSAWLSHYEPSIDKASLVFFARWFYRLLIPFILAGVSIHILLDVWRVTTKRQKIGRSGGSNGNFRVPGE